jgi:hypothetical protein
MLQFSDRWQEKALPDGVYPSSVNRVCSAAISRSNRRWRTQIEPARMNVEAQKTA